MKSFSHASVLLMVIGFAVVSYSEVDLRISRQSVNIAKPKTIRLAPGLVSLIEFPDPIIEVRIGDPKSIKALISQVSVKELTVYLTTTSASPSNLIVRSGKRVFVLDIVPSKTSHQDYVLIRSAFRSESNEPSQKVKKSNTRNRKPEIRIEVGP